jgi:hypothetical protein
MSLRDKYAQLWLLDEQDVPPGVWSRNENEGAQAYDRFLAYLALGPTRTVERTRKDVSDGATKIEWANTASENEWRERADAWDKWVGEMVLRASAEAQIILGAFSAEAAWALVEALSSQQSVTAATQILNRTGTPEVTKHEVELNRISDDELEHQINAQLAALGYTATRAEAEARNSG